MCRRIGVPNVKVHVDVYHMNIKESDIGQAIVETGLMIDYLHTGDPHRGYIGSGSIDLAGVFRAPVKADYQGPITFGSPSSHVVGKPLEAILGIWRNLWEGSHDPARPALMDTKAQLKAAQEAQMQAKRGRLPRSLAHQGRATHPAVGGCRSTAAARHSACGLLRDSNPSRRR